MAKDRPLLMGSTSGLSRERATPRQMRFPTRRSDGCNHIRACRRQIAAALRVTDAYRLTGARYSIAVQIANTRIDADLIWFSAANAFARNACAASCHWPKLWRFRMGAKQQPRPD